MAENEIQVSFSEGLVSRLDSISLALPSTLNKERFVQELLHVLNGNTDLQKCSKASIFEGAVQAALMDLSFQNKEAYLIPRAGKATFQTDYKGEIKFTKAYSTRKIKDVFAQIVHENDDFKRTIKNGSTEFEYAENFKNPGAIAGCFAVVIYEDGGCQLEYMTTDEINSVRSAFSMQAQGKAWKNGWSEMAKKTVLRRLCKHIPKQFCSIEQGEAWDRASDMDFSNNNQRVKANPDDVVDVFAETTAEEIVEVNVEEVSEE